MKHSYLSRLVFTLVQWLDRLVQTRTLVVGGSKRRGAHKWYRTRTEGAGPPLHADDRVVYEYVCACVCVGDEQVGE